MIDAPAGSPQPSDALLTAIAERRGDELFMGRLARLIEEHSPVLDRLADLPFLVEEGWKQSVFIPNRPGPSYRLLGYPHGEDEPIELWTWRFEHRCDRGERGVVICAPTLDEHSVTGYPIVVTPSILCPDCGTHGYIRDGRWTDA